MTRTHPPFAAPRYVWQCRRSGDRQRKAVNRLLDAGPDGFEGGMSTRKYVALTGASPATASRDLAELQAVGVFERVGDGRSTRYYVKLPGLEQQLS